VRIELLQGIAGARRARGLAVIIDVFRAFSLECCLMAAGARHIWPVAEVSEALALREKHPEALLVGERGGVKLPGFDYGNSPSAFEGQDLRGRCIIHTTSAGTRGLLAAADAEERLCGSLLNAEATARYILSRAPEQVSLVCMGLAGERETEEDTLCGEYLRSLLRGAPLPAIEARARALALTEGRKFFDPAQQSVFPQRDFELCVRVSACDFALKYDKGEVIRI